MGYLEWRKAVLPRSESVRFVSAQNNKKKMKDLLGKQ